MAGGECSNRWEEFRVDEGTPYKPCVPKRNQITSVAAIVAPHACDLVRGALGVQAPTRPASITPICFGILLVLSWSIPLPQ